jgi:ribosomal protein S27E
MDFDTLQYERLLNAGIAAIKGGDRLQARQLLQKVTEMKPSDPQPWLWLSATTDDPAEQRDYLEYALAADPGNNAAKRGLVLLSGKIKAKDLLAEGGQFAPRQSLEPEEATALVVFICQACGGQTKYAAGQSSVICQYCGRNENLLQSDVLPDLEQVLEFSLPVRQGHTWAEAQHRLSCPQCGGMLLLPALEKTVSCPYCGNHQLIKSAETESLLDPQMIVLAEFDEKQAIQNIKTWLGNGLFTPDNLKRLAQPAALRPAYYPFWTFDGTGELHWSCEVKEGGGNLDWTVQEGVVFEMFDDEMVSGMRSLKLSQLVKILPFNLKKGIPFTPKALAGWRVLAYDLSLSDASLVAREHIAKKLHHKLEQDIQILKPHRNAQPGKNSWSGMTYKHILLPLWVGNYHYRGRNYQVFINGQTGKISGEKPIDGAKIISVILAVFFLVSICLLVGLILAIGVGWISPSFVFPTL